MTKPGLGDLLDDAARDELAVKHLDLVGRVLGRLPFPVPSALDRDDLISVGSMGLLRAARSYEPTRGASFRTYAYIAIRAAILDELRRFDPLPRGARGPLKALRRFEIEFRAGHGRLPTPSEVADEFTIELADAEGLIVRGEEDRLLRIPQSGADEVFDPIDTSGEEPSEGAERQEEIELVERAIVGLSERERQVVVLYHAEGLYLKEIGELLGVTESRVCQVLACAQRKIRAKVQSNKEART